MKQISSPSIGFLDTRYLKLTGGIMTGDVIFNDSIKLLLGTGSDGELYHDGTNTYFQNNTGGIIIENDASDGDITFKVNDGGVDTTVMTIDGATGNVGIGTEPFTKLDVRGSGSFGRTSIYNSGLFGVDVFYNTNPTVNAQVALAILGEIDTTNDSYTGNQSIGVQGIVRYRGSASESASGKGTRAIDAGMFIYNTGTTQYASGFRLDARNLGTGIVTNLQGLWIPTMLNSGGGSVTNVYGLRVDSQTVGTNNYGVWSNLSAATGRWNIYAGGTAQNYFAGNVGIGTTAPTNLLSFGGDSARIFWLERHTTANTAGNTLTITASGATSAATDKAGGALILQGGLSTGSAESGVTIQGCVAGASGTTDRTQTTAIQVLGNKIGFYAVTPVTRPTALTTQLTAITHTAPGTPDYAIQDFTQTTPFGFVTSDEANTLLSVIANLQTRLAEAETKLQSLGLLT